jgi:hypothetical protein
MRKSGVTQSDLAALIGRDKAVITNLMQGRRALKAEEAVTIARHLGIDVARLLGEKPDARKGVAEAETLIPFRQPPTRGRKSGEIVEQHGRHYLRDAAMTGADAYALEVKDESLNLLGFLPGDIVISELNKPCKPGQIVVVQHYKGAGAQTILRKYEPPFLMPHSTRPDFKPLHEQHDTVRLVSPVLKLIRLL